MDKKFFGYLVFFAGLVLFIFIFLGLDTDVLNLIFMFASILVIFLGLVIFFSELGEPRKKEPKNKRLEYFELNKIRRGLMDDLDYFIVEIQSKMFEIKEKYRKLLNEKAFKLRVWNEGRP